MKKIIEYLELIEQAQGLIKKRELLSELFTIDIKSREFFEYTYSNTVYGISNRTIEKAYDYLEKRDGVYFDAGELAFRMSKDEVKSLNWDDIKKELKNIKSLSGNELLNYLKTKFILFDKYQSKWVIRLLLKDLKIGISLKTINTALKGLGQKEIEHWSVQLCGKFDEITDPDITRKVGFPCIGAIKYDGIRGLLIRDGNKVTFTSRNGENIDYVPELIEYFENIGQGFDFTLDGEILCKDFSTLQKRIGRKSDNIEPVEGLHFRCFDIISWDGEIIRDLTQRERTEKLSDLPESNFFKREENVLINNYMELKNFFDLAVNRREEGIIIKNINAPYDFDSRSNWWKIKPYFENSFKIIDYKHGTGKKSSLLSSFLITDSSGRIKSWIGSGLSDNNILFLMNRERENKLIGTIIDVRYNEISKNKLGEYSLRFPRVLQIRVDKNIADSISL